MTATLEATRDRIRTWPVCEWAADGEWCRRPAVSVIPAPARYGDAPDRPRYATRCNDHRPPGALRVCVGCKSENRSRDPYLCTPCRADEAEPSGW